MKMRSMADESVTSFKAPPQSDYELWTVEELRAFGAQLQLPNARQKSRLELLEIFDVRMPGRWGTHA
jgi:hypothetical protein